MTSRKNATRQFRRLPRVLIFGESENDTKFICELLIALCPDLEGMVQPFRKPPVLIRDCQIDQIPDRLEYICSLIEAERVTSEVICVFAHADCDETEPAHVELSARIEDGFASRGYHVHAVTPAWETESWLFLWPDAVASYRPTWRRIDRYRGREVGRIRDAKEELRRALRPQGASAKFRDYRETDAAMIAQTVRRLGLAASPRATSASFNSFRERVDACCATFAAK